MEKTRVLLPILPILCTILFTCSAHAINRGDITTIAGGGAGDTGAASAASLSYPAGVDLDSAGNLYIAEKFGNRIRRISAATGVITTVAGNGTQGFSGDNGPATAASLSSPVAVTLDSSGNLYIADSENYRIRKVSAATGVITTVAGNGTQGFSGDSGPATAASISPPSGVTLDSAGNILIADSENNRVRRVDAVTGIITTVAGNGAAGFSGDNGPATAAGLSYPSGVTLDSTGNIYIVDTGNNRIRRVDAATDIITTMAGSGASGFSGDNGPADAARFHTPGGISLDSAGNLYVADRSNNRIRRVNAVTGIITTVAGNGDPGFSGDNGSATAAGLNNPTGASLDSAGNIYIADSENHRIRRVNAATGIITTVAGNGDPHFSGDNGPATSAGLDGPIGIALDSSGNLYIADRDDNRIRRVNPATGIITTVAGNGRESFSGDNGPATTASLNGPSGVTPDNSGNLYLADKYNNRIRRVSATTGVITTVAGNGTPAFSGDNGPATAAGLNGPTGVSLDSTGSIYIADSENHRVRRVDAASGIITTVAGNGTPGYSSDNGPATTASLNGPTDVSLDSAANIYIADSHNNRIRRVDAATGIITTVAGDGREGFSGDNGPAIAASLAYPTGVSLDSTDSIYIADSYNNRIRRVDGTTGFIATVAGDGTLGFSGDNGPAIAASLYFPTSVSLNRAGSLHIADWGNARIRMVYQPISLTLNVTVSGNGTVASSPAGFNCASGSCSKTDYPVGTSFALLATPASDSLFAGWSGDCSGDACTIVMNANRSVTATFAILPSIRIDGVKKVYLTPATLQNIYNNAANGAVIELKSGTRDVSDTLTANDSTDKSVTLKGGFDAGYTANSGTTVVPGPLLIRRGTVRVERIIVR